MQNIVNYFRGSVRVEIFGAYPERFFNLSARNGIEFWNVEEIELGRMRLDMTISSYRRIKSVARRAMCKVHIVKKRGFPFFAKRFRKRVPFVLGGTAFFVAAWVFTSFIWVINIDGYSGLDTGKLMESLENAGLKHGSLTSNINISELRNSVLIDMPELSYVSVKFYGSHAEVTVRKREFPPDILPEDAPCDIISDRDGIICDITVKTGTPEVGRGDTVMRGDLLASGYITGRAGTTILTHADAEIRARTWEKETARTQKKMEKKSYTGRQKSRYTFIILGKRINLYLGSGISYIKCDKIIKRNDLTFSDNLRLPIALEKATYLEYETEEVVLSDEEAYELLGNGINGRIEERGETVNAELKTSADETFAYATLTVERIEKIGVKREILKED